MGVAACGGRTNAGAAVAGCSRVARGYSHLPRCRVAQTMIISTCVCMWLFYIITYVLPLIRFWNARFWLLGVALSPTCVTNTPRLSAMQVLPLWCLDCMPRTTSHSQPGACRCGWPPTSQPALTAPKCDWLSSRIEICSVFPTPCRYLAQLHPLIAPIFKADDYFLNESLPNLIQKV